MPKIIPVARLRLRRFRRHRRPDAAKTAARAVLPLPRRPDAAESRIIGAARSKLSDDDFRQRANDALAASTSPRRIRSQRRSRRFLAQLHYVSIDATAPDADWSQFDDLLDPDRVRVFYLATSPDLYGPICERWPATGWSPKTRAWCWKSRSATTWPPLCAIIETCREGVHRGPDLPHRPLPGQGDGAEPDGAALRQHDLRAAVDRRRDRPRADHGGRNGRAGGPRRLLRQIRRACATWCRTTCCSCCA